MNAKTTKSPAKPASAKTAAKPGNSKISSGLIGKLRGALTKKAPAPAAKAAPAKPAPAAKTTKASVKAPPKPSTPAKPSAAAKPAPAKNTAPSMKTAKPEKITKPAPVAAAAVAKAPPAPAARKPAPAARRASTFSGMPTEDDIRAMSDDEYMNDAQVEFFRTRLLQMRAEVLEREVDVKERLHQREVFADPADRATAEEEHWLDLRLRERESLLLRKIDDALRRLENREYGYCEKTGDPIGIPRLLARPTATVCVDVKGQDERVEAQFRDR